MGKKFASLTLWLLSANCRVAVRSQMYHSESQVLYKLIFIAFYWFQILIHDHLLILTHIILTFHYIHDCIVSEASQKQQTQKQCYSLRMSAPNNVQRECFMEFSGNVTLVY